MLLRGGRVEVARGRERGRKLRSLPESVSGRCLLLWLPAVFVGNASVPFNLLYLFLSLG